MGRGVRLEADRPCERAGAGRSPSRGEPVHIHVVKDNADAKFWLFPEVEVAYNRGFNARILKQLQGIIEERREEIEEAWNDHFS